MIHNSRKVFSIAMVVVFLVFCWLIVAAEPQKTTTGFYWPTGKSNTKITAGFRDTYTQDEVTYDHLGTDWTLSLGSKVYAVSDGLVLYVSTGGWGTSDSGNVALLVLHETTESRKFIAIYGHIKTKYKKGDKISAGKEIGTIGPWIGGSHLHFGIYLSDKLPSGNFGRVVLGENVDPKFTDPTIFLTIKKPKNSGQINIQVDEPILEQPIKLPNTGSEYKIKKSVYVDAKWSWTDTGIDVEFGDEIYSRAWGKAMYVPQYGYLDPHGTRVYNIYECFPTKDAPQGALIGKIGSGGHIFYVGETNYVISPYHGRKRIYLGINDDNINDNDGGWTVEVIVK